MSPSDELYPGANEPVPRAVERDERVMCEIIGLLRELPDPDRIRVLETLAAFFGFSVRDRE